MPSDLVHANDLSSLKLPAERLTLTDKQVLIKELVNDKEFIQFYGQSLLMGLYLSNENISNNETVVKKNKVNIEESTADSAVQTNLINNEMKLRFDEILQNILILKNNIVINHPKLGNINDEDLKDIFGDVNQEVIDPKSSINLINKLLINNNLKPNIFNNAQSTIPDLSFLKNLSLNNSANFVDFSAIATAIWEGVQQVGFCLGTAGFIGIVSYAVLYLCVFTKLIGAGTLCSSYSNGEMSATGATYLAAVFTIVNNMVIKMIGTSLNIDGVLLTQTALVSCIMGLPAYILLNKAKFIEVNSGNIGQILLSLTGMIGTYRLGVSRGGVAAQTRAFDGLKLNEVQLTELSKFN